jgi:hypothetical protein
MLRFFIVSPSIPTNNKFLIKFWFFSLGENLDLPFVLRTQHKKKMAFYD